MASLASLVGECQTGIDDIVASGPGGKNIEDDGKDIQGRCCLSRQRISELKAQLPFNPHQPELGSWLFRQGDAFGCKACYLQSVPSSPWATLSIRLPHQMDLQKLRKHESSLQHQRAVAALTSCPDCKADVSAKVAAGTPSDATFEGIFFNRIPLQGQHRYVNYRVQFCLAEAMRLMDHAFLTDCMRLSLHMDGRGKRLTMQFSAVNPQLEVRRGLIGHIISAGEHTDTTENWYRNAIEQLLDDFCTSGRGPPRGQHSLQMSVNKELREKLKVAVTAFNTDAARTMVLTGMEVSNYLGDVIPVFPNQRASIVDPVHAARRSL